MNVEINIVGAFAQGLGRHYRGRTLLAAHDAQAFQSSCQISKPWPGRCRDAPLVPRSPRTPIS